MSQRTCGWIPLPSRDEKRERACGDPAARGKLSGEYLFTYWNGDKMGNLELAGTVKMLQGQRVQVQKELAKLDKAIAVLRELSGTNSAPTQNGKRHTISAAARRKIGKAQKARWAKVKQQRSVKG
ncbi:MAG: hypothetical protein LAN18_09090 [Acidobacteriia bacterium]|nr:hypothetical protein [Terriglobia bacterium]